MKNLPEPVELPQFLSGWKEIANFMGMGVRTVQRYEQDMGLPVRRPVGKTRGSVVAVRAEIDGWVKASPIREVFQLRQQSDVYSTDALHQGISELTALREQMSLLRAELRGSVTRLQNNVRLLQGQLNESLSKDPSPLYSSDERDLLERTTTNVMAAPVTYLKAS